MRLIGLALALDLALAPLPFEAQQAWDRQAVYAAREARLKEAIDTRPADGPRTRLIEITSPVASPGPSPMTGVLA
jgi:hypothetical protein